MRLGLLVCALLALQPASVWAEWQVKPFVGATFSGDTNFLLSQAAGKRKLTFGAGGTWLGTFIGVEGDFARVRGYFEDPLLDLVRSSSVTTMTGNVVLTLPRKYTEYGLRPYLVGGGGVVRINIDQGQVGSDILDVRTSLGVVDFGGGATGFLTDRIGLNWDVRYFRSVGGKEGTGLSIGKERISFWRASMGVAIRLGAKK